MCESSGIRPNCIPTTLCFNPRIVYNRGQMREETKIQDLGIDKAAKAAVVSVRDASLFCGDALRFYRTWPRPTVIMCDGPYGLGGYPGDPPVPDGLGEWYRPHVAEWSERSMPSTTLWFWGTEIGWATVHPLLAEFGWEYRNTHIWDKGIAHIAGNCNSRTIRKFPVVTENCVQYVRRMMSPDKRGAPLREWMREEWKRAGLRMSETNSACGVKNAATRKYFTNDHLWYPPPPDIFKRLSDYANKRGMPAGRPYFSADGRRPLTAEEWGGLRAKFNLELGVTNVWSEPSNRGRERVKNGTAVVHNNQKPLKLVERCIRASSDPGDVVWEPFGGMCTAATAAVLSRRRCFSAEINRDVFNLAAGRLESCVLTAERAA